MILFWMTLNVILSSGKAQEQKKENFEEQDEEAFEHCDVKQLPKKARHLALTIEFCFIL